MEKIEPSKVFDSPYYIVNKRLLIAIGLWPNLSRARKNASLAVFTIISFSLIIPIFAGIKKNMGVDVAAVCENCFSILYLAAVYSKYLACYLFQNRIKLVYQQTISDWRDLTDEDELGIQHKYSKLGRFLTLFYLGYATRSVCMLFALPFMPLALDNLMPLENRTHEVFHPYHPNYFVIDSEKYFFELYTLHGFYVLALSTLGAVAIDTMMVANIIHVCGLFAIVRLENIGKLSPESEAVNGKWKFADDHDVYRRCKSVCELHLSSINSATLIQESFSVSFLVVMGAGVVGIGMLMFDFLHSFKMRDPVRLFVILVSLLGVKIALFYLNWVVQQLTNASEQVFQSAYYSEWYNLSVKSRKMICIILQNSRKPIGLSAASLFDLDLEMFASLLKTSMSYATVVLSLQQQE